ncbi:hypothetical protein [Lacipirellula parvula]|uniref:Uncharacterized protein n=1 Tax=Lacipirellula parvula TaxID=2650471 RepID=A0A5K7XFF0_9BACT|nr:hypothetical protein [Lacipirellula parvula]BBO32500.1 hypothetical protein PLANPX_2112 [Lacipirellula parvula]BBO33066.1 hypothetical protein PLANPX_2678 [Lacipirellula parvula]
MLKALRYTLAAICLAASVGCLALWWRSHAAWDFINVPSYVYRTRTVNLQSMPGTVSVQLLDKEASAYLAANNLLWRHSVAFESTIDDRLLSLIHASGAFGRLSYGVYFPHWYAALVFALAAVAAIRIGRQFTLRSALVGMSVVAALLGMVVAL